MKSYLSKINIIALVLIGVAAALDYFLLGVGSPELYLLAEGLTFATVEDAVKHLETNEKFIIRDPDQEKQFLENYTKKLIDDKTREFHSTFENNVRDLTGIDREDNEKSYDYLKRAWTGQVSSKKELENTITEMQKKLKEYEEKGVKGNDLAEQLTNQLNETKNLLKKANEEKENVVKEYESKAFESSYNSKLNDAVNMLRPSFKKDLPKEIIEHTISSVLNNFKQEIQPVKLDGGGFVFNDKDGKPMVNVKNGNMLSATDILEERLNFIIDEKRVQSGAGSGDGGAGSGDDGGGKYDLKLPDTVKSRTALIGHLKDVIKVEQGSRDFDRYYNANKEGLPVE